MRTHQVGAVLCLATACLFSACKGLKGPGSEVAEKDRVKVEFYVMSKCPFGVQVENSIKPVLDQLGHAVNFQLDYIAGEQGGQFNSLHGEPEVKGNLIQLCVKKYYPDVSKYMGFVACQNREAQMIPDNWEKCAQETGVDKGKVKDCYEGNEGKELLRASIKRSQERHAQGSPTIYLAGQAYQGGRDPSDFTRAICEHFTGKKPDACSKIPEPVQVTALVLTDKRCKECVFEGLEANLRGRFFPKLTIKSVDYSTPEGKKLYKDLGMKYLPVWLFEPGVEKSDKYTMISRWMVDKGKYKELRIPAKFDPTAEICDNKIDDTGDGKVDCDDPTCKGNLACRAEKKNQADVFVMSQCPFGVKALDAMKEVLPNFKGKLAFDLHFIADETKGAGNGFSSMHGPGEVQEDLRQICAKKYYKKNNKFLDYIWCRNKNVRSDEWQSCAKEAGLAVPKIEKCSTGDEGKTLLSEDIKVAKELDISGSPTWLANNRTKFSGIAADAIKASICQYNSDLPNCDKKLAGEAAGAPAAKCN